MKDLNGDKLAKYFDYTYLKPFATVEDIRKVCDEAIKYGFKMVVVNSVQTKLCKEYLKDSDVHVGAKISFPLGQTTIEAKVFETEDAIENGADEIDYVINITEVKAKNYDYIEDEMRKIAELCRKNNVICKAIFENCYLEIDEIIELCRIALKVKPDFIKTSTGFGIGGATAEDIILMKSIVKDEVKVKASGGIRDLDTCLAMIELGADRIGTSSSVEIIKNYLAVSR